MYIQLIDWVVSALSIGSFVYASYHKERIDRSLQFNITNIIIGILFTIVGIHLHVYGMVIRQIFFAGIAGINLYGTYRNYKNKMI